MKSAAGIALLTILVLSGSCSSTTKTEQKSENQQTQVQSVPEKTSSTKQPESNKPNVTENSQLGNNASNSNGKLTIPQKITPNKPVSIQVKAPAIASSNNNNSSQPKQMNLVVVSNDLRFFDLVQASYKNNQNIEVKPKFPAPGAYTVFSDYNPNGENKQVSVETVSIPGKVPFPTELESFNRTKTVSDTKIDLNLSESNLKAGKKATLKFNLKQASNNKPIPDLKSISEQKAKLIIIKSSSPLVESDYIEIENIKSLSDNQVNFTTIFPKPGTYKLWLQFNHNSKVETADFWVTVKS